MSTPYRPSWLCVVPSVLAAALVFVACKGEDGDDGPPGPPGPPAPTNSNLAPDEDPPGLNVAIVKLIGGSLGTEHFDVGDKIAVQFTLKKNDGSNWDIAELSTARFLVSGPTFNYQRVLPQVSDV